MLVFLFFFFVVVVVVLSHLNSRPNATSVYFGISRVKTKDERKPEIMAVSSDDVTHRTDPLRLANGLMIVPAEPC